MIKKLLTLLMTFLFLGSMVEMVTASLITIGTADYDSNGDGIADVFNLHLIHDDDSPLGPITWLDYTNGPGGWQSQVNWAASLGGSLTNVSITPGYNTLSIDWTTGWRLPTTNDYPYSVGYDGTTSAGYNITSSEMGHLYYEELDNLGKKDTAGGVVADGTYGLINIGDFKYLIPGWYWSGTDANSPTAAWDFNLYSGLQDFDPKNGQDYSLAVRPGAVTHAPLPGTLVLLGSGCLASLAGRRLWQLRHHKNTRMPNILK